MAESSPSPAAVAADPNPSQPDPLPTPSSAPPPPPPLLNPNHPTPAMVPPPLQQQQQQHPFPPPPQLTAVPPPSFRPATPQFSPLPVPPPGITMPMMPGQQQVLRPPPFAPMPNGFPGMVQHQGIPRYLPPFNPMVRPAFLPRPPGVIGTMPPLLRPPMGIRGPIIPPMIRPVTVASVAPVEKPQTTVYVGKISTVENDFILPLLQLCGPVKAWKRAQDPSSGKPKGFGFCEFETAEGILRALRLLSKLNLDGQELLINITQATKEYLERYVEKKAESSKELTKAENAGDVKEEGSAPSAEDNEPTKLSDEESNKDDKDIESGEKNEYAGFGIVTDEDREADREALEKLTSMIEERLKNNPLPPPPPLPAADGSSTLSSLQPAEFKDGDSDVDNVGNGEDKRNGEMASNGKPLSEQDKPQTSSPDRTKSNDRSSRDKERDKRDKERELERFEKERELERARRERDREYKSKEEDRRYKARLKEWESREKEKEHLRKMDKEKEKKREYKRKQEVIDQELEDDDGDYKRRKHKSIASEERRRRLREKEDDLADRLKEDEEIAEAKRRAEEELRQRKEREKDAPEILPVSESEGSDKAGLAHQSNVKIRDEPVEMAYDSDSRTENHSSGVVLQNGSGDESAMGRIPASDMRQNNSNLSKKLGFGLVGSGKRTAAPSLFKQEEDEDAQKAKKMRPLVPIDYSTEELQAVQSSNSSGPSSNLAAAAEFAKQISNATIHEDRRPDAEREKSRRSHDRSSYRERNGDDSNRSRDESRKDTSERDRDREHRPDKSKAPENKKLLDAKQLIDMIPRTKEEIFSYQIDWAIFDKNELHDRMRPWVSKKIHEFLGEDEPSLVDFIVSSTRQHVEAGEMLVRLQAILDDEAEMFVLKMWRMLIFEIKKIQSGLAQRS